MVAKKMLKKLRLRSLEADDTGAILISGIIIIVAMLVGVYLISTIAGAIIPLAIFLILAIVFVFLIKKVLFGGKSLGITSAVSGFGREAGRETVGLMKSAKSEYGHYKKKEGGW